MLERGGGDPGGDKYLLLNASLAQSRAKYGALAELQMPRASGQLPCVGFWPTLFLARARTHGTLGARTVGKAPFFSVYRARWARAII